VQALFAAHGASDYVGEAVSQEEHALQCAKCATDAGAAPEEVAAALLHDVGHLLGLADPAAHGRMGEFGVARHEDVGRAFCDAHGLPTRVGTLVQAHVQAKRYLCWRNPGYAARLSAASTATLRFQGGPMGDAEAAAFEAGPDRDVILRMRGWDEAAKVVGAAGVPPLTAYAPLLEGLAAAEGGRKAVGVHGVCAS